MSLRGRVLPLAVAVLAAAVASSASGPIESAPQASPSAARTPVAARRLPLPAMLVAALERAGITERDLWAAAEGRAVARSVPPQRDDEVAMVGLVRIGVPASYFKDRYRNVRSFEPQRRMLGVGRYSTPATVDDMQTFVVPPGDLEDLDSCRPGRCPVHLPQSVLETLAALDWTAPNAGARARDLIRAWAADYVNAYRREGNAALFQYGHRVPTRAHVDDARSLIDGDGVLRAAAPEVAAYLRDLRAVPAPFSSEEFFYWSVIGFARKTTARINHVVIVTTPIDSVPAEAIVSRTIFASHYLRDGLEVLVLLPDAAASEGAPAMWLIMSNRSHTDDLLGIRGALLRGIVRRRARSSFENYLREVRVRLETGYRAGTQ